MTGIKTLYKYGMRLRGFSPGAQPKDGWIDAEEDPLGDYWNILVYERRLTKDEEKQYDLDYLGQRWTSEFPADPEAGGA